MCYVYSCIIWTLIPRPNLSFVSPGRLCPRRDRVTCPLHGRVIPRTSASGEPDLAYAKALLAAARRRFDANAAETSSELTNSSAAATSLQSPNSSAAETSAELTNSAAAAANAQLTNSSAAGTSAELTNSFAATTSLQSKSSSVPTTSSQSPNSSAATTNAQSANSSPATTSAQSLSSSAATTSAQSKNSSAVTTSAQSLSSSAATTSAQSPNSSAAVTTETRMSCINSYTGNMSSFSEVDSKKCGVPGEHKTSKDKKSLVSKLNQMSADSLHSTKCGEKIVKNHTAFQSTSILKSMSHSRQSLRGNPGLMLAQSDYSAHTRRDNNTNVRDGSLSSNNKVDSNNILAGDRIEASANTGDSRACKNTDEDISTDKGDADRDDYMMISADRDDYISADKDNNIPVDTDDIPADKYKDISSDEVQSVCAAEELVRAVEAALLKDRRRRMNLDQDWQDPLLLAEIRAATGVDLDMRTLKKRRRGEEGGLTDLKKAEDTPHRRLEKKVFSKRALKRRH
ncbi:putative GPI-anchored protein pfl2 [Hyalella azteca]|uniref:GPI-anchored protein pfl2 n=1 Tax=Hyalella azteca TaxID=294128 RepID=A0A979FU46_HYAAZ|nr:putative GPI-anchored protein pfl2 [Hyalella azteca]